MRKSVLNLLIATLFFVGCKEEKKESSTTSFDSPDTAMIHASFGVRGNCGMCKKTIEKAAQSVEGVTSVNWDVALKKIEVSYDDSKTDVMQIHHAIANAGYDTDKVNGSVDAYQSLPSCCQYDHEMEMNRTTPDTTNTH